MEIKVLEDTYGNEYRVGSLIGQGGQGAVYRLKDESLAAKILIKDEKMVVDENIYNKYSTKMNGILIMRINDDVHLCKPEVMLKKPNCGYIMKLLSDLEPINELIYNPSIDNNLGEFLLKKGGLKKRYEVLIELARSLARLHSQGLVYCDLSPNNIFYSPKEGYSKIWLIDCDNLKYTSDIKKGIFTPFFGAPEVENNVSSNTIFSDCFSFAILAHYILLNKHPFLSTSANEEDSSSDWDATTASEPKDKTYKWVFEENEDQAKEFSQYFINSEIYNLFKKTFSKEGIFRPETRPSMRSWYEALKKMYLNITKCKCGQYVMAGAHECPFCKEKIDVDFIGNLSYLLYIHHDQREKIIEDLKDVINANGINLSVDDFVDTPQKLAAFAVYDGLRIYDFSLLDVSIDTFPELLFSISKEGNDLYLYNHTDRDLEVYSDASKYRLLANNRIQISNSKKIKFLYFNKKSNLQYLIRLRNYGTKI